MLMVDFVFYLVDWLSVCSLYFVILYVLSTFQRCARRQDAASDVLYSYCGGNSEEDRA